MSSSNLVRRLLGVVLLVTVAVLAIVVVRYFINSAHRENRPAVHAGSVDVALKNIHFTENAASIKKWELYAANGEYDKAADRTSLQAVRFVVEREGKGGPITVTARHGEYAHASKNVDLYGDVLARTEDGTTFTTPKVMYDSSKRVLRGKEQVSLADAALVVEGTGFDFAVDSRDVRIHSNVVATIYPGKRKR